MNRRENDLDWAEEPIAASNVVVSLTGAVLCQKPASEVSHFLVFDAMDSVDEMKAMDGGDEEKEYDEEMLSILNSIKDSFESFKSAIFLHTNNVGGIVERLLLHFEDLLAADLMPMALAIGKIIGQVLTYLIPLPELEEMPLNLHADGGASVLYSTTEKFVNSTEDEVISTAVTFYPKSVLEIQNVLEHAKLEKKRVRATGMRTSSARFVDRDEICISLLPEKQWIPCPRYGLESRSWNS